MKENEKDKMNWKEYKEKRVCPICRYAGKNTVDPISGFPLVGIAHRDFALRFMGINCKNAEKEEKRQF